MPGSTLEQQRAQNAWQCVTGLATQTDNTDQRRYNTAADDYAREAKKLPIRIMTSGLGQALAFIKAKAGGDKKDGLTKLNAHLGQWVIGRRLSYLVDGNANNDLLETLMNQNALFLRLATEETIAWLAWLNRLAEAEGLPAKQND